MAQNTDSKAQPQSESGFSPAMELLSEIAACGIIVVASLLITFLRPLTHLMEYLNASMNKEPTSEPTSPTKDSSAHVEMDSSASWDDSIGGLDEAEELAAEERATSFGNPMLPSHSNSMSLADLVFSFRSHTNNKEADAMPFQCQSVRRFRSPADGGNPRNPPEIRHRAPAVLPFLTPSVDHEKLASSFATHSTFHQAALAAASKDCPTVPNYIVRCRSSDIVLEDCHFSSHAPDDDSVAVSDSASQVVRNRQHLLAQMLWWVQHHISAPNRTAVGAYAVKHPDRMVAIILSSFTNKEELLLEILKVETTFRRR